MSVRGFLDFCAEVRGFNGSGKKKAVDQTLERCFLKEVRHQTISTLSKGYKQRVCFAQSIIHDPQYLVLDEPTDGLDPNQKHEVRLMIKDMSAEKAIILSTHILDEVEAVCSRAIIIAEGRIVADDTPEGLRSKSTFHGAVTLAVNTDQAEPLLSCLKKVPGAASVELISHSDKTLRARVFPENNQDSIGDVVLKTLSENSFEVSSTFIEQGRLDEVFRMITTRVDSESDG
jgi:ABC-2 type transport system ATP-binding protein